MKFPEPAQSILEELQARLRDLLGANLHGMYVYGSLAFGCYNPARSDVDVIVVTRRRLAAETRSPLSVLLRELGPAAKLEISFLSRADLDPWRYPCPFDYHFSHTSEKRDGAGVYFAAEIVNARTRGVALVGPPTEETLPDVPDADYLDCVVRDIRWARENFDEVGPVYAVLNCCRVLAYANERVVLSKADGGEWGVRELPRRYRPLAERALQAYRSEARDDSVFARQDVWELMDWVEATL
jgi:streptomycin 3"-adenylyltransferase